MTTFKKHYFQLQMKWWVGATRSNGQEDLFLIITQETSHRQEHAGSFISIQI
jgi:hypothetical protein